MSAEILNKRFSSRQLAYFQRIFSELCTTNGYRISSSKVAPILASSGVAISSLKHIWLMVCSHTDYITREELFEFLLNLSAVKSGGTLSDTETEMAKGLALPVLAKLQVNPANFSGIQDVNEGLLPQNSIYAHLSALERTADQLTHPHRLTQLPLSQIVPFFANFEIKTEPSRQIWLLFRRSFPIKSSLSRPQVLALMHLILMYQTFFILFKEVPSHVREFIESQELKEEQSQAIDRPKAKNDFSGETFDPKKAGKTPYATPLSPSNPLGRAEMSFATSHSGKEASIVLSSLSERLKSSLASIETQASDAERLAVIDSRNHILEKQILQSTLVFNEVCIKNKELLAGITADLEELKLISEELDSEEPDELLEALKKVGLALN